MNDIAELVQRAAGGDTEAFARLYERTKNGVWYTCVSLLKNEENAKDILQDTYLSAFEKIGALENPLAVQSWLNKIAANKCKDSLNSGAGKLLTENVGEILETIPDDRCIPEECVENAAKRGLLMNLIENALSEEQYRTVLLYYFDEMTAAEIAKLMDCHEKTVLYRLKTARLRIKEEVLRYEEKNRDKLHTLVPIALLTRILKLEAESMSAPPKSILSQTPPNALSVPPKRAAAAADIGGKTMLHSLKSKIIAGICAVTVIGGGVSAGVLIANGSKKPAESRPVITTAAKTESAQNNASTADDNQPSEEPSSGTESPDAVPTSPAGEVLWDLIPEAPEEDFMFEPYFAGEEWGYDKDETLMITQYRGDDVYVKISSMYEGKLVGSVTGFLGCQTLAGVYLPDGIVKISRNAFWDCESLAEVVMPSSLREINSDAFMDCESLENVMIPDGVKVIGHNAFRSCSRLKSVTLPDSIEKIGTKVFWESPLCEVHYKGKIYTNDNMEELYALFN